MAYWMTSTQIAAKYEVSEQEILSWAQLKEISSTHVNDTLMIDDDSVQSYMETNRILAEKQIIRERLIHEEDTIIEQELKKYDAAALFIRLQSECFPLYELLIKALAAMIPNVQERKLFCAITGGYSPKYIPKYHNMSDKDTFKIYLEIIRKLRTDMKYILIMQRQVGRTFDKFLKEKKGQRAKLVKEINDWKEKCEQLYDELSYRDKEKEAWILLESSLRQEIFKRQENELQMKKILYDLKHILDSAEERSITCDKQEQGPSFYLFIVNGIMDFLCHIKERVIGKYRSTVSTWINLK